MTVVLLVMMGVKSVVVSIGLRFGMVVLRILWL